MVFNGQGFPWQSNLTVTPQVSVLGSLLFLLYIYDPTDGIESIRKMFEDDTSVFFEANDKNNFNTQLNSDLWVTSKRAFHWKTLLNKQK